VYRLPQQVDAVLGALAEPLACVIHGLETVQVRRPQEVVVVGVGPIGLLFVGELAELGVRIVAADTVATRLEASRRLGVSACIHLDGTADDTNLLRAATAQGRGAPLVVEATGTPAGWDTAIHAASTGGTVLLFGGCAPGTSVNIDAHWLHYNELTIRGAYHHRPATFAAAVDRLAQRHHFREVLISEEASLEGVEQALQSMATGRILKAAVRP
jgi:L-iditol 2-dehydrogenase